MTARTRLLRFVGGLALVAALLIVAFAVIIPWIHTWGATPQEVALQYPGDETCPQPIVNWTHGITINAPPEKVWPWIAQLGERRGGYYSYTFIENLVAGGDLYHNADRILPEFHNPQPGDVMIGGALKVREVKPGQYLLADSSVPDMGWTWLWLISPTGGGKTRLVVRTRIQPPAGPASNPVVGLVMDAGGFVMENRMMQGLKARAEGYVEPAYAMGLEIALWVLALLAGLGAAVAFLTRPRWQPPLIAGVAAVLVLLLLTFVQPALWVRAGLVLLLLVGLRWAFRPECWRPKT